MRLCFEQVVPLSRERLFRFHELPEHLGLLLERRRGFRLLSHGHSIERGNVTWVADSIAELPVVMAFEHVLVDRPSCFEEHMIHGPFDHFRHRHVFEEATEGTRVVDEIELRLRCWLGGELGTRLVVAPHMERIFRFRHRELLRLVREGQIG